MVYNLRSQLSLVIFNILLRLKYEDSYFSL